MSDEVIGDLTAARTRYDDEIIEQIAELVGLAQHTVQQRLHAAHGAKLVRNVFADTWPKTAGALAEMHVKQAREAGLFAEIAQVTGLDEYLVRRRLQDAHGKGFLENLFADDWPDEARDDEAPDSDGEAEDDLAIGDLTAARARRSNDVVQKIAELTGRGVRSVKRQLEDAHGATRVRNIFSEEWPADPAPQSSTVEQSVWGRMVDGGRSAVRGIVESVWSSGGAGSEEQEDEVEEEESGPDGEDDAGEDDEQQDNGDENDLIVRLRVDREGAWSRPRQLKRVLRLLGIEVPQRLRVERFREALQILAQAGIEACLADDEIRTPLTLDANTPGIHAEVRLRIATAREPPATPRPFPPETSPPPIVLVSRPTRPAPAPASHPREPAHETALRRLQFLTAVPSTGRQHEPEWPDAYLDAATAGLEVTPMEVRHLRMVAASFVKGHHSPEGIITRLVKMETALDLEALVARFRHLNRRMSEDAEEVLKWMGETSAGLLRFAHPRPHATATAHAPAAHAASPRAPQAAGTVKLATHDTPTNVRDLGVLEDMFKD